ncbi:hypothetical protein FHG64_02845 [Antarcticibacterium flavum]|uniref:Uncharacterized protein n=1 Tax=Antarcticibacterium flavum TaxID=2058175 RepID=A0A5B7WZC0_9FLAO|nr:MULTISPECIES: hypothetical protein [Antarcticibacterium]MCM4161761.1 hypothetical protein [Antarcticibacterium sp. W02-3]QCY68410.1 hypothetical protein FHG64_02845 [Antarcticibacterium flavum]
MVNSPAEGPEAEIKLLTFIKMGRIVRNYKASESYYLKFRDYGYIWVMGIFGYFLVGSLFLAEGFQGFSLLRKVGR